MVGHNGMTTHVDLAIVGCGIVGAMTVRAAAARFSGSVGIFERYRVSSGTTALSGGLMPLIGPSAASLELALRSRKLYAQMLAEEGSLPIDRRVCYWIHPAASVRQLQQALGRKLPFTTEVPDELREHYPSFRLPDGHVLARDDRVWSASAQALTRRIVEKQLAEHPASFTLLEGVGIETIGKRGEEFQLERTDGEITHARRVIVGVGPWVTLGPVKQWAANRNLRTKRTICIHLEGEVSKDTPVLMMYSAGAVVLPVPGSNKTLVSYFSEDWDVEPKPNELCVSGRDRDVTLGIVTRCLPGVESRYVGGQVFCDAYSDDKTPLVEEIDFLPGCVAIGGFSGSGVRLAPGLAEDAMSLVLSNSRKG
jgi:glycine/D-amino acid oxidase-like deaminating enzyme